MVAKNNYFWTEKEKEMDFIANGETAVVRRVRRTRELYGLSLIHIYSAQLTYSEPIARATFLQFSSQFQYKYSESDKTTYDLSLIHI